MRGSTERRASIAAAIDNARAAMRARPADQPYLHVFLQTESIPVQDAGGGLTAAILFPAREETLGGWLRDRALRFFHHWRMS